MPLQNTNPFCMARAETSISGTKYSPFQKAYPFAHGTGHGIQNGMRFNFFLQGFFYQSGNSVQISFDDPLV
jgi:hypothetical protein